MEYYNFAYDPNLESFLHRLNRLTSLDLLNIPADKYSNRPENSRATQSKGKLSSSELPPYLIQDLGYPGILTMVNLWLNKLDSLLTALHFVDD